MGPGLPRRTQQVKAHFFYLSPYIFLYFWHSFKPCRNVVHTVPAKLVQDWSMCQEAFPHQIGSRAGVQLQWVDRSTIWTPFPGPVLCSLFRFSICCNINVCVFIDIVCIFAYLVLSWHLCETVCYCLFNVLWTHWWLTVPKWTLTWLYPRQPVL